MDDKTPHESSWTPLLWAMKLLTRARMMKRIEIDPPAFSSLQSAFEKVETCNRKLLSYGWVNFPLAYTQVKYVLICVMQLDNYCAAFKITQIYCWLHYILLC